MKIKPIVVVVGLVLLPAACGPARAAEPGPLKVFILAGQSNMEGKAAASTLEAAIADPKTHEAFRHLKKNGRWAVRDDVWVTFLCKGDKAPAGEMPLYGPLTVGFGGQKNARDPGGRRISVPAIGPELGFGYAIGDYFKQQVLLIKTAWGGKSLRKDFLPPGAGGPGEYYTRMVQEVRKVLGDIQKYFGAYDRDRGYEITGFVWFQGWNDGVGRGNPAYTEQLAQLIRDIRKEFDVPSMPVVIGELGVDGDEPIGWIEKFREQQAAVARIPQFKGNVRFVRTAPFWPEWYKPLDDKYRRFKAREKAWIEQLTKQGKPPTRQQITEFGDRYWREPNKQTLAQMSDKRYHYMGCGKTYYLIGQAFGRAMIELLEQAEPAG